MPSIAGASRSGDLQIAVRKRWAVWKAPFLGSRAILFALQDPHRVDSRGTPGWNDRCNGSRPDEHTEHGEHRHRINATDSVKYVGGRVDPDTETP